MHYLFLVSFAWMALEGVVLYLVLVKIFRSKSRPARDKAVFLLCGWGECPQNTRSIDCGCIKEEKENSSHTKRRPSYNDTLWVFTWCLVFN